MLNAIFKIQIAIGLYSPNHCNFTKPWASVLFLFDAKKVFIKMGAEINTYSLAVIKSRRTFGWKKYTYHSHALLSKSKSHGS